MSECYVTKRRYQLDCDKPFLRGVWGQIENFSITHFLNYPKRDFPFRQVSCCFLADFKLQLLQKLANELQCILVRSIFMFLRIYFFMFFSGTENRMLSIGK